ncbi:hypothetical protein LA080_012619 [Diaporthe eres]|nr:hypothetical protein LA080_012619 [Diaporthe eres]
MRPQQPVASTSQQVGGRRNARRWGPRCPRDRERGPRSTAQPEAEPALPVLNEQALLDMSNGISGPTGATTIKFLANLAVPRSLPGPLAALACEHAVLGNLGTAISLRLQLPYCVRVRRPPTPVHPSDPPS